jgi:hypothetical protein
MEASRVSSRALLGIVLRRAVVMDRGTWGYILALAFIVFIPLGLLEGTFDSVADRDIDVTLLIAALTVLAGSMVGEVFYSGAVAGLIAKTPEGGHPSLFALARRLPLLRLLAADVLVAAIVIIGAILLIVPGLIFLVWLAFVAPAIEIEERRLWSAVKRSRELVRGRFWLVLLVVVGLGVTTELAVEGIKELAHLMLGDGRVVELVAEALGNVVTGPPYAVIIVLMALELMRERPARPADST